MIFYSLITFLLACLAALVTTLSLANQSAILASISILIAVNEYFKWKNTDNNQKERDRQIDEANTELYQKTLENKNLSLSLQKFITGGDNRPIIGFNFDTGLPYFVNNQAGQYGEYIRLRLFFRNNGVTPINSVKVRFHDIGNVIDIHGYYGGIGGQFLEASPGVFGISGNVNVSKQIELSLITPGTNEEFYEFRIPTHHVSPYRYTFFVYWNTSWYVVNLEFTYCEIDQRLYISKEEYFPEGLAMEQTINEYFHTDINSFRPRI